jgi:hypothetical protein
MDEAAESITSQDTNGALRGGQFLPFGTAQPARGKLQRSLLARLADPPHGSSR